MTTLMMRMLMLLDLLGTLASSYPFRYVRE